jgi:protein SCO1
MKTRYIILLIFLAAPFLLAKTPEAQKQMLEKVGFTQNLGAQVPLDLPFRNELGQPVHLRDYFGSKPVILSLVYFECPMLCTETLNGLVRSIRTLSFDAGNQYNLVTVSFDPKETATLAAAKKRVYVDRYGRKGGAGGWAFLTGDEGSIRRLADSVGFHYAWDKELGQFAHATGIIVLTPEGRTAHYFYGVEYSPKDLHLALLEASAGKIGSPVDQFLLYCYRYDPMTGRYTLSIYRLIRIAALGTLVILAGFIFGMVRREKKRPGAA